jgi:prolyl-tRNA synthetase
MDYASVKGFIDYLPYGYAIWEEIQNYLNKRFKENGAQNVYLPCVIPTSLFNKEKEHIEGFAPECLGRDLWRRRETRRSFGDPSDFGDSFLRYV